MKTLITCASHAHAHRLKRILDDQDVVLGDSEISAFGSLLKLPSSGSETYAHEMLKLCLDSDISRLFPLSLHEIKELAKSRQLFEEYGISILIPSHTNIEEFQKSGSFTKPNLLVIENGEFIAGLLPQESIADNLTGIYEWEEREGKLHIRIFITEDVGI